MNIDTRLPLLIPDWPMPSSVHAFTTLRYPGASQMPYAAFNLALHTGDRVEDVLQNRRYLRRDVHLPAEPKWLTQTHSDIALPAEMVSELEPPIADASYTREKRTVCVIMTADCLPILVTNQSGTEVAAIHAGWQGLAKGIIERTLSKLVSSPSSLLIWIGPSIQAAHYEVGEDVYNMFSLSHSQAELDAAFQPKAIDALAKQDNKWLADVPLLAEQRLRRLGILKENIYLSQQCSYSHADKYFSYRRDGITGRMASLIWMD